MKLVKNEAFYKRAVLIAILKYPLNVLLYGSISAKIPFYLALEGLDRVARK